MCGILGIYSKSGNFSLSDADLALMRDMMAHRGPDDSGIFMNKTDDSFIALAHRRLSIIDLSNLGHQPMWTADNALCITYNGEIFNYADLRGELCKTGKYNFRSQSDTEVILYSVKEWGIEGALNRFRGMYAFALFDKLESSLTLVRDPLGVKPLYYLVNSKYIAFASEIKALTAIPGFEKKINMNALNHYLTFANAPAPDTLFDGVFKLEAGTYIKIDRHGSMKSKRYWNPANIPSNGIENEQECIGQIRDLLRQSVTRRMVSDVPFGVFLSGGVDSSLNVALMAEQMNRPVDTYSVGISGDPSNEFEYARKVAAIYGANHHEIMINDDDFISFLPKMAYQLDEPLADPVCVPLYYVSKLARESGTIVIQVGEGSDEIFAGYEMYRFFTKLTDSGYNYYCNLPQGIKKILYNLTQGLLDNAQADALRRAIMNEPLFMGNAIAFWDADKDKLLKKCTGEKTSGEFISEIMKQFSNKDTLLKIINLELKNRLPELLLMRVDKMSMAASIETRVPFLDEDLVKYALSIPSRLKQKDGHNKYILKKAAEGIIPDEIIYRKKWGFCGSATNIMSDKITDYARKKILGSPLSSQIFNLNYVNQIFSNHKTQKRFNSFKIWNLLNLVLWFEGWFGPSESI